MEQLRERDLERPVPSTERPEHPGVLPLDLGAEYLFGEIHAAFLSTENTWRTGVPRSSMASTTCPCMRYGNSFPNGSKLKTRSGFGNVDKKVLLPLPGSPYTRYLVSGR